MIGYIIYPPEGGVGIPTAHMAVIGPSCACTLLVDERSFHSTMVPSSMPVKGSTPKKAEETVVRALTDLP